MTQDTTTLHKALVTIKKLKQLLQDKNQKFEPVAITGIGCRLPGAKNKDAFWELLQQGKNAITALPEERWALFNESQEAAARNQEHAYWGSYLTDITAFDSQFFGITPREAVRMDPQQRLLLEVAYESLEDAGLTIENLAGSNTGIFTSLYTSQLGYLQQIESDMDALYIPTGNAGSIAANRLSYLFDLHGPSMVIDTACSSSLVAIHLACMHLQNKLCDTALVSAANINIIPSVNDILARAKMLSPDGQCKTFDSAANGYVPGEGVCAIVLTPLATALKNNSRIYAVIAGSAVNQDGKTNGLTAPNGLQQEAVLKSAYSKAGIDPNTLSYIECHGTGTFLGDPIELQALGEVVSAQRDPEKPCWIGSLKTNIGHLEPAAGLASAIKVALGLQHKQIPPHLNCKTPNPHINFNKCHFRIPQENQAWPVYGESRVAGISGFGFGGTNAHVVVRELADQEKATNVSGNFPIELFTLSAKNPEALQLYVDKWIAYLEKNPILDLAGICHNLHLRRSHYSKRVAIPAAATQELLQKLISLKQNNFKASNGICISDDISKPTHKKIIDTFTVLSAQSLAELYIDQANIHWEKYEENRRYALLDLPTYPWQHQNYWPPLKTNIASPTQQAHPFKAHKLSSPLHTLQYAFSFNVSDIKEIIDTHYILHAGYYLEMLAFAASSLGHEKFNIENLKFTSPLVALNEADLSVQLLLEKTQDDLSFVFYSANQAHWTEHAHGKLILKPSTESPLDSIEAIKQRCPTRNHQNNFYDRIQEMGMPSEGSLRWIQQYHLGENEILCELQQPKLPTPTTHLKLKHHFSIIDACIQGIFLTLPRDINQPYVASYLERITFFNNANPPRYLYSQLKSADSKTCLGNWYLLDEYGNSIAECENMQMTKLGNKVQIRKMQESTDTKDLSASDYLINEAAAIFSMPKNSINIHHPLADMGMDSLMALVLNKSIEQRFKVSIPMQQLLTSISITGILDYISTNAKTNKEPGNRWLAYRKTQAQPEMKLFCFPYGGGGASIYSDWQQHLSPSIEVCPIQIPGRENRLDEAAISDLPELIDLLIHNLQAEWNTPFAFFGHSFGALIGFELIRELRRRRLPLPMHFFASAFPDPRLPTRSLQNLLTQLNAADIHLFENRQPFSLMSLSKEKINNLKEIFAQQGLTEYRSEAITSTLLEILLPIFIADVSIVKNYSYQAEAALELPITVFLGSQDKWVLPSDHSGWSHHTNKTCKFYEFDSAHLFIKDNKIKIDVIKRISQSLNSLVPA